MHNFVYPQTPLHNQHNSLRGSNLQNERYLLRCYSRAAALSMIACRFILHFAFLILHLGVVPIFAPFLLTAMPARNPTHHIPVAVSSAFKRFLAVKKIFFGPRTLVGIIEPSPEPKLQHPFSFSTSSPQSPARFACLLCDKFLSCSLHQNPESVLNSLSLHGLGPFAGTRPQRKNQKPTCYW